MSVHLCLLHFGIYFLQHSSFECWIFHSITRFSVSLLMLVIMCSPFFFLPSFFPPVQASCVSLINLYHSLVNCVTFTSCCQGIMLSQVEWKVQFYKDRFTLSFPLLHFSPVTLSYLSLSPVLQRWNSRAKAIFKPN